MQALAEKLWALDLMQALAEKLWALDLMQALAEKLWALDLMQALAEKLWALDLMHGLKRKRQFSFSWPGKQSLQGGVSPFVMFATCSNPRSRFIVNPSVDYLQAFNAHA